MRANIRRVCAFFKIRLFALIGTTKGTRAQLSIAYSLGSRKRMNFRNVAPKLVKLESEKKKGELTVKVNIPREELRNSKPQ